MAAQDWLRAVAAEFVALAVTAGVAPAFQVGEPWWWVGPDIAPLVVTIGGEVLRPLAPVHLHHARSAGEISFDWIPQSRAGFGWPDLTDVPLAEPSPRWRLTLRDGTSVLETDEVSVPAWRCADRPGPLWLEVAQVGHTLGRSAIFAIP